MPTTATISRDQRVGIYEVVRNHLGGLDDVWIALETRGDFATAERLSLEFVEDVRLLDDIGWDPDDSRETFELTMPREDLVALLRRLGNEAEIALHESPTERRAREEDEETDRRLRLAATACEAMLVELDHNRRESDERVEE